MKQCMKCKYLRPDNESEPTVRCPKCGGEYVYIEIGLSTSRAVVPTATKLQVIAAPVQVIATRPEVFDYKNATPAQLKTEYDRIAKEIGDDQFYTKKELLHVPQVLGDGEQVLAFSSGYMDGRTWLIVLTDRRILFLDKGMIYGLKQDAIDLDKVNTISAETGLFLGTIKVQDGAVQREIRNVLKKTVLTFTNKARDAIEVRKRRWGYAQPPSPSAPSNDMVTRLERLAALKDKGILSQQEFDGQKAKLLAE